MWLAGVYSFSDELGGFTITGVTGTGTKDDPIVITEELNSASPVTLVIRATQIHAAVRRFGGDAQSGFTHLRFVVLNNSGLAWVEFEFELQEHQGPAEHVRRRAFLRPAPIRKRATSLPTISPSSAATSSLTTGCAFSTARSTRSKRAAFSFLVTDFTPRSQFYIVQDPRIPSS